MSRALLIDLDGTLADSLTVMRRAYFRFLAGHGKPGCDAEFDRLNGPPLARCAEMLKQAHALAPPAGDLVAEWFRVIGEEYPSAPPAPGARALLEAATAAGWRCCLVTSSSAELAGRWLEAAGLAALVPDRVTGELTPRGKPFPDPYLAGLALTGAEAALSAAVEDSPAGAAAALAAGLPTYVVASGHGGPWPEGVRHVAGLAELLPLVGAP